MGETIENERILLEQALDAFRHETGLHAHIQQLQPQIADRREPDPGQPDALIQIEEAGNRHNLAVEIKKTGADRLEAINQLRVFWPQERRPPLVLVTPYMTTFLAEQCKQLGLFFLDTAGNMYLKEGGLYLYVIGKRKPVELRRTAGTRLNNAAGLKLMFAFLCKPELLNKTYRDAAHIGKVALGTVGQVVKELEAKRLVTTFGATLPRRKFIDRARLIQNWVAFYPANLRPKQNPQRFRATEIGWAKQIDLTRFGAYWGGEMAAQKLTGYLTAETLTIYTRQTPTKLITEQRLRADVNGNVEILNAFWDPELDAKNGQRDVVPPLLAYADLMTTTAGRNLETAKLLYDRYIAPTL
ncbi:MAG TPA: type IV toxin-antitoxin system AbiEi family antitoxin [Terriglobales bacterium]|nr:type IV toxin-antitoxin system AbiEi family antitoxin [Terriglobales bacterium]